MTEKSEFAHGEIRGRNSDMILREAKALGDPTRYHIFRYIEKSKRPVYVDELTKLLRINHNAVRQHLTVLKEAELVVEQLEERTKPGRPRLQYSLSPQALGSWGTEGPYQTVAVLMAEVIKSKKSARDVGRSAGKSRFARVQGSKPDTLRMLRESLVADGFSPRPSRSKDGWDFVLERCPYAEAASVDPATVCQLHLGLLEGMAHELDPKVQLSLAIRDPRKAGCKIHVKGSQESVLEELGS